jgi:hypothetical protein
LARDGRRVVRPFVEAGRQRCTREKERKRSRFLTHT